MLRTGFRLHFEEISPANPAFGSAAVVPWDSDLFGFPVASYKTGATRIDESSRELFVSSFHSWMKANTISLCSCVISVSDLFWRQWLPELGFRFVDLSLQVNLALTTETRLAKARVAVRRAEPGDRSAIETIANQSFAHGRYHADPLFPRELANRRYLGWMRNALSGQRAEDCVFVLGKPGQVVGFYHVTIEGDLSDLRLAAVAPHLKKSGMGAELYTATLHALRSLGIRRVVSTISSANTSVMNVYSSLGFRFSHPEVVYHWHAENWYTGHSHSDSTELR